MNVKEVDGDVMIKSNRRIYWFDLLKILACLMIITNHTIDYLLQYAGYNNFTVLFYAACLSLCKIGVPLFIMITGCLLLKKESNYREILGRIKRVLFPLIVVSLIYYFSDNNLNWNGGLNFIKTFFERPIRTYLWYLYMLIGLYLITPFLQKMIKSFSQDSYRNLIIICLVIPGILSILNIYFNLSFSPKFLDVLFPVAIVYYISGLYLSTVKLTVKYRNLAFISLIMMIIFLTLSIYIPYLQSDMIVYKMLDYTNLLVALSSFSVYYLFRYYFERKTISERSEKVIVNISLVTFGIYLIHNLISYRIYLSNIMQWIFNLNCYLGVISLILACFIVSGLITYILRKIPVIKNYL